jgi:hypothetical protein
MLSSAGLDTSSYLMIRIHLVVLTIEHTLSP